ncbi:MAG TPA: hypothetical protein VGX25_23135 [Actinophytocola sp.]|uniref:hypothetical protein n=1 Tax=Actinophytocola sp. TaxID=1872138 RepID=UPI002DDDB9CA|nr:hypothetical protein [Actinophytocola sp.]HEV2782296.1 hypothetical protein [Actinophytocola sp.]
MATQLRRPNRAVTAIFAGLALLLVAAAAFVTLRSCGTASGHQAHVPPPSTTVQDEGLKQAHDGFRLELVTAPEGRGPAVPVAFRILDLSGRPQLDYDVDHTKLLHFYVLRDDLSHYQHLHPELRGDTWHTAIAVPDGGLYRLYAEFLPKGRPGPPHPTVLGVPFVVPGDTTFVPLPAPAASVELPGLTVRRTDGVADLPVGKVNRLTFRFLDAAGEPVDELESYLGAYAHMSAFNSLTMGLLHQHPLDQVVDGLTGGPELSFAAQFALRGEHRLFLEFSVAGRVHRAEFTVFVT